MNDGPAPDNSSSLLFLEIKKPFHNDSSLAQDRIEVLTSIVEPRYCNPLLKELSNCIPKDDALVHLKRVKRHRPPNVVVSCDPFASSVGTHHEISNSSNDNNNSSCSDNNEPKTKKSKFCHTNSSHHQLQILIGQTNGTIMDLATPMIRKYNLVLESTLVPGRPAESVQEMREFNTIWPTIFFERNTIQHREQQNHLTDAEIMQMVRAMEHVLLDRQESAVILDPVLDVVISKSRDEWLFQQHPPQGENLQGHDQMSKTSCHNPLSTPVLLALQGVSRIERKVAMGHGMESDEFQKGQYLCTGYDIYLRKEPSVFEAMALVHARIRRVVFGVANKEDGGLGGTGKASSVHLLPSTNHRYRVFVCAPGSALSKACETIIGEDDN